MMSNEITIYGGNVGGDVVFKTTPGGKDVASFSVASNRRFTNSAGEKVEETIWVRCSAWDGLARICRDYVTKGREVTIRGRLQSDPATGGPRIWVDQNGNPRASYEITVEELVLHGKGSGAVAAAQNGAQAEVEVPASAW